MTVKRQRRFLLAALFCAISSLSRQALADAYDPPANYYTTATGTGATLKQQLHVLIDATDDPGVSDTVATPMSYDSARSSLQVTDADPNQPGRMLAVYDRTSINVAAINPGGSIPGWDSGATWNREHTWPQSRGVGSTGPDTSDLFNLRPALTANNGDRGNLNYGGAFGQPWGVVSDGGSKFYPGDADAGMIARQEFYMAVRYDGSDTNTTNLELFAGDPTTAQGLGDLNRMIEWHYAAVPDLFERKRNQTIFTSYQHNRNPFTDHPEYVWSIFVNQTNDSRISITGATVNADGSSTRNVDLGRVFTNAAVPAAQALSLTKAGNNGTYFEVTASGAATSSLSGPFNAMRTNQTDTKAITVGLNTTTTTAGLKSGTVTVNNLDITTGGGAGRGANDANDTFNVSLAVLDHARPSFASPTLTQTLNYNFGNVAIGDAATPFTFDVYNLLATAGYTAGMDFDSVTSAGNSAAFSTNFAAYAGSLQLAGGAFQTFSTSFTTTAIGAFTANYTLNFSDENIAGALNKSITLSLSGIMRLAGDYNGDLAVDASDYVAWRELVGQSVTAYSSADGDGNGIIDSLDYDVWRAHFGPTASGSGSSLGSASVPEPATFVMVLLGASLAICSRGRRG